MKYILELRKWYSAQQGTLNFVHTHLQYQPQTVICL